MTLILLLFPKFWDYRPTFTMLDLPEAGAGTQGFLPVGQALFKLEDIPNPTLNFILFSKAKVFAFTFHAGMSKSMDR